MSLSCVRLFATPWTVAHQAPPSKGFFRQEYWRGLPFPSPADLPDRDLLQTIWATRKPWWLSLSLRKPCSFYGALPGEQRKMTYTSSLSLRKSHYFNWKDSISHPQNSRYWGRVLPEWPSDVTGSSWKVSCWPVCELTVQRSPLVSTHRGNSCRAPLLADFPQGFTSIWVIRTAATLGSTGRHAEINHFS